MESNFIKERTVVREDLIRKNLSLERKNKTTNPSTSTKNVIKEPHERVVAFEELVNEGLKQELVVISQKVDRICETIADYLKIKSALKIFKSSPRNIRAQTNLGCNFYAQCHIENASKVYLCIGQDYYLYMELEEALKMIDLKEKQWTKQLDLLQERAAKIKAYIKIAFEAMGRLYDSDIS